MCHMKGAYNVYMLIPLPASSHVVLFSAVCPIKPLSITREISASFCRGVFQKNGGSPIKIGCFIMWFFSTNSFDDFGLPRDAPGPGWGRLWRDGEDDDGKVRNCWVDDFHLKGSRMMQRQRKLQKVWKSEARTVALKWDWNRKCIMRWTELSFVGFCNLWQRCVQFAICHPWVCKGEWQTWVLDQWYPSVWYFSKVLNHHL